MTAGDWHGACDAFTAVIEVAEVPEAFYGLASALFWLGDVAGTIACCEKAYAGFRRRGDPMFAAGAALSLVGYNKGYLGNTAAARGWLSRAARIVENEVPELRGELLGATAYVTDDPAESEALARQAAEIGRANGHSDLELMAMHAVGQALVQQGRIEDGMSLLDEAMAGVIGGEGRDPMTVAQMSCMTMVVCGSCFDLERATQWVQSLQGFIDRYGCPFLYAECRAYYGRVLFENGDWAAAEAFLTDAITMSRGVFAAPYAFAAGTLAELRLAQGRVEDAARVLRGVEGRAEAAAAVGSLHLRRGEASVAAAVLRRRLAATADAAAALMRDLGIRAARTGPRNIGRLTKRELEVLALLGEGLSNPQIAERLFLSRKTVEHHVARILSKLGLRGRTEAAALAARQYPPGISQR